MLDPYKEFPKPDAFDPGSNDGVIIMLTFSHIQQLSPSSVMQWRPKIVKIKATKYLQDRKRQKNHILAVLS